jgi:hypothetical protein
MRMREHHVRAFDAVQSQFDSNSNFAQELEQDFLVGGIVLDQKDIMPFVSKPLSNIDIILSLGGHLLLRT